ncbi:NnrU family protein [Aliiroseovarius sp. S2029]|uniref:NnrU family protein n=1 Tax=Aliiroseovarius sp. S2029 TaxID=2936988 RepID=UPI0020BDFE8A|nr:NnrU family protein [Aliiroseovarius sp. S2029]MCK8485046.1 NnrU family protein [Aliiroseovarius sp. S2029]
MTGWGAYFLAFLVFFLTHSIPVRPAVKSQLVGVLGPRGFTLAYSALSIAVLALVIVAAGRAPDVTLWHWEPWQNHVTLTVMFLVCVIAALALGRPNPLSFGGAQNDRFDPDHPGLIGWMRHPLLVALFLWAFGHMVPNGNLAHVILFVVFAGFALLGMWIIDRRKKRILGPDEWSRLADTRREIAVTPNGLIRVGIAVAFYALLLWLHGPVIGVEPLL